MWFLCHLFLHAAYLPKIMLMNFQHPSTPAFSLQPPGKIAITIQSHSPFLHAKAFS